MALDLKALEPLQNQLEHHPVYAAVRDEASLQVFMQHHVFSVWDFMSLLKRLQAAVAPAHAPWMPAGNANLRRFINDIVREEECDELPAGGHASHFEMYETAMYEVGADTAGADAFLDVVRASGLEAALESGHAPAPCVQFMRATFGIIEEGKPHCIGAAFALGREHVIPRMFRSLLDRMGVGFEEAPMFHYYLKRHTHLDEEMHGPLAIRLLEDLCGEDAVRQMEALKAAELSLAARMKFWDEVLRVLQE
tara:strand:+ start:5675 stop:6427 length:753 start_codon:yes stop_codon:yes gene_type:complete